MRSLHIFSLLLIIVVHTASGFTPLPAWVKIDENTCSFVQTSAIKNAFSEMIDIAIAAFNYGIQFKERKLSQDIRNSVGRTTNTYFGITIPVGSRDRLNRAIGRRF